MARLPMSARVGIYLIAIGVAWVAGWATWASTRIRVPLDVPISLAKGRLRTPEFRINLATYYVVQVYVSRAFDDQGLPCLIGFDQCEGKPSVLRVSWSLSDRTRSLATGSSDAHGAFGGTDTMGRSLGGFYAPRGRYVLDVDVSEDGSRLSGGSPRLMITGWGDEFAIADDQASRAFLHCLFLVVAGYFLIIRSALMSRWEKRDALLAASSLTQRGPIESAVLVATAADARGPATRRHIHAYTETANRPPSSLRRLSSGPLFPRLSWISLIMVLVLLLLVIPLWVMVFGTHLTSRGLPVRLLRPDVPAQPNFGMQAVLVQVEAGTQPRHPRLYINRQPVSDAEFEKVLQKELKIRPPNWPVYLEGDPNMEWADAVYAIDLIRGLHADVILVTPSMAPRAR